MKNVKVVKVISPIYGLEEGDVLSRVNQGDSFSFKAEHIGESFSFSNSLELSEEMVDNENFGVVSYFKTKKEFIKDLQNKVSKLEAQLSVEEAAGDKFLKMVSRLDSKYDEFSKKHDELSRDLYLDRLSSEDEADALLALTVYDNLMDFIRKVKA
jgi:hypothetical protein